MPKTIIEYLHHHVAVKPDEIAFSFLPESGKKFSVLTFKEFWFEALSVANFLKSKTQAGDKVLLIYAPGLDYVIAFYGCLLAGVVAVPVPLPNKDGAQLVKVVENSQPVIALTTLWDISKINVFWREQDKKQPLKFFTTDNSVSLLGDLGAVIDLAPKSPAFLHYRFDSTGIIEETTVSHCDIIENIKQLPLISSEKNNDIFINWLPFFYDKDLVAVAS